MARNRASLLSWFALFLSTAFFTGFVPGFIHPRLNGKGGGLMGSLVALGLLWFLWSQAWCTAPVFVAIVLLLAIPPVSTWIVGEGEKLMYDRLGPRRRHTGETVSADYNETCYDEVVGMFVSAVCIWPFRGETDAKWLILAFIHFRIFDTFKPWPISAIEKMWKKTYPAFSVVIDDIVAGACAGATALFFLLAALL